MEIALLIWAFALTVLIVIGLIWVFDLQNQLRQLQTREEDVLSTELSEGADAALKELASRLSKTTARTERLVARADRTDETLAHAVQGVGLVRFRAFKDTGGDQSFALALADGEGNGVVVSALYGRDATRIYAKPVKNWRSPRSLTGEEEQALMKARRVIVPEQ